VFQGRNQGPLQPPSLPHKELFTAFVRSAQSPFHSSPITIQISGHHQHKMPQSGWSAANRLVVAYACTQPQHHNTKVENTLPDRLDRSQSISQCTPCGGKRDDVQVPLARTLIERCQEGTTCGTRAGVCGMAEAQRLRSQPTEILTLRARWDCVACKWGSGARTA
jgi:hypothetical protein